MKSRNILLSACLIFCCLFLHGQSDLTKIPDIEIDFAKVGTLSLFEFSDLTAWRLGAHEENSVLELFGQSDYQPKVRSPFNIAILRDYKLGSFVLEADLRQTGREYGHRDMVLVFGLENNSNFYYVHIASKADAHAHNIFLVRDAPRKAIGLKTTAGINWGDGWNKVKIERNIENGRIAIYFNDMSQPIMEGQDVRFKNGYIGFGSFDDTGMFDNIRIWSDDIENTNSIFSNFNNR